MEVSAHICWSSIQYKRTKKETFRFWEEPHSYPSHWHCQSQSEKMFRANKPLCDHAKIVKRLQLISSREGALTSLPYQGYLKKLSKMCWQSCHLEPTGEVGVWLFVLGAPTAGCSKIPCVTRPHFFLWRPPFTSRLKLRLYLRIKSSPPPLVPLAPLSQSLFITGHTLAPIFQNEFPWQSLFAELPLTCLAIPSPYLNCFKVKIPTCFVSHHHNFHLFGVPTP